MKPANLRTLTINGGSSSVTLALFETGDSLQRILKGAIERIGLPDSSLRLKGVDQADDVSRLVTAPDHAAALGGLDALVFAGSIGENAPIVRVRICAELGLLGIELDEKRNAANEGVISATAGRVSVRVIPTNKELTIARSMCRVLRLGASA